MRSLHGSAHPEERWGLRETETASKDLKTPFQIKMKPRSRDSKPLQPAKTFSTRPTHFSESAGHTHAASVGGIWPPYSGLA